MESQRQRMQMGEDLQRYGAHRALRHLGKKILAQLGKCRGRQAQYAVCRKQRQWQHQDLGRRQLVDDLFHHQRHADVGKLGSNEASERQRYSPLVGEQIGQQSADGSPVAANRTRGAGWRRS